MSEEYQVASAFKGLMVVKVRSDLLTHDVLAGTDSQGRAVLYLPQRGWYRFWVTHAGAQVTQHYDGPLDRQPEDFVARRGPWESYNVATMFGMSHDSITIN